MKRALVGLCLCGFAMLLLASPAAAEKAPRVANIFELDESGNVVGGGGMILNGEPVAIGQLMENGLLQNPGSHPAVLALSNGAVILLEAGQVKAVDAAGDATQRCICKCGDENMTLPETDKAKCTAHTGERCQDSTGKWHNLSACNLTWVATLVSADGPAADPRPGRPEVQ